jgi:alkanesulfonate monooxygenase SsuD/methylene tetrahydromethanopterin reductase-like flavin-dependent oxidoreductase (luciferase family)
VPEPSPSRALDEDPGLLAGSVAIVALIPRHIRGASEAAPGDERSAVDQRGEFGDGQTASASPQPCTLPRRRVDARYVRTRAVDRFNITPHHVPSSLTDIVDKLAPELQDRGVYRTEYQGDTLREHPRLPTVSEV